MSNLRALTLGRNTKSKPVIVEVEGAKFEVRKPSVRERATILKAAGIVAGKASSAEIDKLQAMAVINCVYDPETGERVFTDADLNALLDAESGSYVDVLGEHALHFLNVEPAQAAGN